MKCAAPILFASEAVLVTVLMTVLITYLRLLFLSEVSSLDVLCPAKAARHHDCALYPVSSSHTSASEHALICTQKG
jgi:hypothetical protein